MSKLLAMLKYIGYWMCSVIRCLYEKTDNWSV